MSAALMQDRGPAALGDGNLPAGWMRGALKRWYRVTLGKMVTSSEKVESRPTQPYLRSTNVQDGVLDLSDCKRMWFSEAEAIALSLQAGDLVVCEGGDVGRSALLKTDLGGFGFQNSVNRVRTRSGSAASTSYLQYWLKLLKQAGYLDVVCNRATIAHLTADKLSEIRMPFPPYGEQQAIAAFLDRETAKIDALVAEQERLLVLLEEKRQAVIANAVTKGLDPTVPMKDSGVEWLGQVPAHWSLQPIRWLSTFVTSGPRGWSDHIDIEGSLFIQSGDLTEDATIEFSGAKRVKVKDDAETARTSLQDGDVVVCITGAKTGKVAVCTSLPETAYVNQHLCLIRPKQDVISAFLGQSLKSRVGREHFQSTQYGLKQGLSLDDIKTAVIPLPPRAEQKHILGYLSAQERVYRDLSEEAQQLAKRLGERRAALISAAVTGKLDVRALASAAEPALAAE